MPALARAAALLTAALLAVTLAACGDNESSAEPTGSGDASSAFPVTVEHKFGATEIASEPERVVTVGYTDSDPVLALGVVPVGVAEFLGGYAWRERPWAQEALGGAEPAIVSTQEINFEAVAAQRPDLIVAINAGLDEADYERLSQIAPTVAQSGEYRDFSMPWDEQTLLVGRALGREERARELVADVEAEFERVRAEHPEFAGKTAILGYGGPDGYGAYSTGDVRSRFLTDLGFEIPERIDELAGDSFFAEFSQEHFRLLEQDLVVMAGPQEDILANPVVQRLDAVEEDRIVFLDYTDPFAGAMGYGSALSLPYLLETGIDAIAAAADGDPGTVVEQPQ